jgi:hypothetical protein
MSQLSHECDDDCACPVHGTLLLYWPAGDDHACQDPACEYAHGVNDVLMKHMPAPPPRRPDGLAGQRNAEYERYAYGTGMRV